MLTRTSGEALLLRDGELYRGQWDTTLVDGKKKPMRFFDESGNLIPLKPGQTWIHIMPSSSTYSENSPSSWQVDFDSYP